MQDKLIKKFPSAFSAKNNIKIFFHFSKKISIFTATF